VTSEDMPGQVARCVRHKCEMSFDGVRVAIDGRDAAGKTTLTDRLPEVLQVEVGEVLRTLASTVGATPKSCGSSGAARTQRATVSTPLTSSTKMRSLSAWQPSAVSACPVWLSGRRGVRVSCPHGRRTIRLSCRWSDPAPTGACRHMGSIDLRPPGARGLSSLGCGAGLFAHGGHGDCDRRDLDASRATSRAQRSTTPANLPDESTQPSEDRTVGWSQCGAFLLNLTTEAQNLTAEHDDPDRQLVPFGTAQPAQLKYPHKGQTQEGR
jgi:hypothetical protein